MNEYDIYAKQYDANLSRVRSFLSAQTRSLSTLNECNRLLSQAKQYAISMEQLASQNISNHTISMNKSYPSSSSSPPSSLFQIREFKIRIEREIEPLQSEVNRALQEKKNHNIGNHHPLSSSIQTSNRDTLFSNMNNNTRSYQPPSLNNHGDSDNNEMERLIQTSEEMLFESKSLCNEAEYNGRSTLETMGRQRDQLFNAKGRINDTRDMLDESSVILKEMTQKTLRNKRFLQCVVVLLLVANLIVIYAILKRKFFPSSS